jgi:Protein of unknown function (DUF3631)
VTRTYGNRLSPLRMLWAGDWPKRARVAAVALITEAKERDPSLGVRLLADLKSIFGVAQEMTTEAIAGASCSKQVAME